MQLRLTESERICLLGCAAILTGSFSGYHGDVAGTLLAWGLGLMVGIWASEKADAETRAHRYVLARLDGIAYSDICDECYGDVRHCGGHREL